MIYKWKICCIKIVTTIGEEFLKAYGFDAANQMSSSIGSRAVTDIVTGTDSSWQNYVGDGVGGTVAGIYTAITHDASSMVAGVISGSVSAGVTDVLNNLTEEDDKSDLNIIGDMLLNGVVEGVLGKVGDKITKGRGNYAAVFKGGINKESDRQYKRKITKR